MEQTLVAQLKRLAAIYAESEGTTLAMVAKRALNDNTFFTRVDDGASFTLRTYDNFIRWMSDNWPSNKKWPADIERPCKTRGAA